MLIFENYLFCHIMMTFIVVLNTFLVIEPSFILIYIRYCVCSFIADLTYELYRLKLGI